MIKILLLLFLCLVAGIIKLSAQVAINADGSPPDPSAMLDVQSSNKGFLLPRIALVSLTSPDPIINPSPGIIVYNTAYSGTGINSVYPGLHYWNGGRWVRTEKETHYMQPLPDNCIPYGTVTDYEGNVYPTILINGLEWMARSLRSTRVNDGGAMDTCNANPDYIFPDNNPAYADSLGILYYKYMDYSKILQICPEGWRLPYESEWASLANFLGGYQIAGGKLKRTTWWGTNDVCFCAEKSGSEGSFYWWEWSETYYWYQLYPWLPSFRDVKLSVISDELFFSVLEEYSFIRCVKSN